jgi:hypothetical protein
MNFDTESTSVKKTRCPKCAATGADTRGDNLHLYTDGHSYCFACGFYQRGDQLPRPVRAEGNAAKPQFEFSIPDDASGDIPYSVMSWLSDSCRLTFNDIITNKIMWSESQRWLIFPIEHEGTTIGFQARNMNLQKPYKWYTKFPKKDLLKIYGTFDGRLVLVEDIISAIRVSKLVACAPLFGALISDSLFMKISRDLYAIRKLHIWLDQDKKREALMYTQRARELGFNAQCICSDEDPKTYTNQELRAFLGV